MLIAKFTLNSLFHSKAFFGGIASKLNPRATSYCAGVRCNVIILDVVSSNLKIRRFISFLSKATSVFIKTLFVLSRGWDSLFKRIVPYAYYAPYWVGGVLSNYSSTYFYFKRNKQAFFIPRMPGIGVFLSTTKNSYFCSNEAAVTRTPSTILFDGTMKPQNSSYIVGSNLEFGSANFCVDIFLITIKRGIRLRKLTYKKLVTRFLKKILIKKNKKNLQKIVPLRNLIFRGIFTVSSLWLKGFSSFYLKKTFFKRKIRKTGKP